MDAKAGFTLGVLKHWGAMSVSLFFEFGSYSFRPRFYADRDQSYADIWDWALNQAACVFRQLDESQTPFVQYGMFNEKCSKS